MDNERLKRLKTEGREFVVRIKPPLHDSSVTDLLHGNLLSSSQDIGDFIILNHDGSPAPCFASACDDMLNDITLIIRENKQRHLNK